MAHTKLKPTEDVMQVAKTLAIGLSTLFISSNIWAYEMSNQMMMCEFDGKELLITVPMPDEWSKEKLEEACMSICNSIRLAGPIHVIRPVSKKEAPKETIAEAVCDTDYNCEVLWEKYKTFNIKSIYTAPDNRQRNEKHEPNVLEITCKDNDIKRYTAVEEELPSICQAAINIIEAVEDSANVDGSTDELSLNWYQLEAFVEANMIPIDRSENESPTTSEFIDFMKIHPEATVEGIYRNEKGVEKACKILDKPYSKNDTCFKDNYGLHITELTIRFGESDEIPSWFSDFCKNADDIVKYDRGFWQCTW